MLARAKNWLKVGHVWVRAGEEFQIDESQFDQVAGMAEIIEKDSSPADEPPVASDNTAVADEPSKQEPAKKPRKKSGKN